jgi:hypothetical protein
MKTEKEGHKCYILSNAQAETSPVWIKFINEEGMMQSFLTQYSKGGPQ